MKRPCVSRSHTHVGICPPHLSVSKLMQRHQREKLKEASNGIQRAEKDLLGQTHLGTRVVLRQHRGGERGDDQRLY